MMYGIEGLLAGRTLVDRYRVEEVIGRGGMGAVYRARDLRLGRDVATKVISVVAADPAAHARLRARFQREARAAAGLHHPNVVSVHDFGTDPELGLDFLVMELLRGEDLAARLARKGPLAMRTALHVMLQAARGVAAGHRAGLIHRDIKPGNLFLEPGDRLGDVHVRVLDFGIAEVVATGEQTLTHLTVLGRSPFSPAYASPEQLRGEARLTPTTDVFSLGAVAFHLLTGERPFVSADPGVMSIEVASSLARTLPRARVPDGVQRVIHRALAADPDRRYATAGALADALADAASGARIRARGATRGAPPRVDASRPTGGPSDSTGPTRPAAAPPRPEPDPGRRLAAELQGLMDRSPPPAPPRRFPRLRRAGRRVLDWLVTATAFALFGGAWAAVAAGFQYGEPDWVLYGTLASIPFTPLALHRLLGGRGSYRLGLFASLAASVSLIHLLSDSQTMRVVLATVFAAQLCVSFAAERLTHRRSPVE